MIRVFDIEDILKGEAGEEVEALQRLQDLVNRTQWKKCTFSGDGEFIVAGGRGGWGGGFDMCGGVGGRGGWAGLDMCGVGGRGGGQG